jgi:hypothetical protein
MGGRINRRAVCDVRGPHGAFSEELAAGETRSFLEYCLAADVESSAPQTVKRSRRIQLQRTSAAFLPLRGVLHYAANDLDGMAMSPAVTSVFPFFVTSLGGHQTARTLHFVAAISLVLFLFLHVGMVVLAGFTTRMMAMIFGRAQQGTQNADMQECL